MSQKTSGTVMNLTQLVDLNREKIKLLEHGLSCVPRLDCERKYTHRLQIETSVTEYHRRINLADHFGGSQDEDWAKVSFRLNTGWEPSRNEQFSEMVWDLIEER